MEKLERAEVSRRALLIRVGCIGTFSLLMSWAFTFGIGHFFRAAADPAVLNFIISTIAPLAISIPVSFIFLSKTEEIAALNIDLENACRELQRLNALNEKRATIDAMTGLFNRVHFLESADTLQKQYSYGSLLMLDVDHFKKINDRWGHAIGDTALASVAFAISQAVRRGDIVGRLGGEEFGVYLPETDIRDAASVAERIRRNVEQIRFSPGGQAHMLTVSIGVSEAAPGDPLPSILRRADHAMYESKNAGRNTVRLDVSSSWSEVAASLPSGVNSDRRVA